jgi:hypothetical protein
MARIAGYQRQRICEIHFQTGLGSLDVFTDQCQRIFIVLLTETCQKCWMADAKNRAAFPPLVNAPAGFFDRLRRFAACMVGARLCNNIWLSAMMAVRGLLIWWANTAASSRWQPGGLTCEMYLRCLDLSFSLAAGIYIHPVEMMNLTVPLLSCMAVSDQAIRLASVASAPAALVFNRKMPVADLFKDIVLLLHVICGQKHFVHLPALTSSNE